MTDIPKYKEENGDLFPSNQEIIDKYLNRFRHSKQSVALRKTNLNIFFNKKYFGYDGHIFKVRKREIYHNR